MRTLSFAVLDPSTFCDTKTTRDQTCSAQVSENVTNWSRRPSRSSTGHRYHYRRSDWNRPRIRVSDHAVANIHRVDRGWRQRINRERVDKGVRQAGGARAPARPPIRALEDAATRPRVDRGGRQQINREREDIRGQAGVAPARPPVRPPAPAAKNPPSLDRSARQRVN